MARYAYESTPIYIRKNFQINGQEWEAYPLLEKQEVLENEDGLMSAKAVSLYLQGKLIPLSTSGSTGQYIDVYWSHTDYKKSMAPLWLLRKRRYGVNPGDKLAYFFTVHPFDEEKATAAFKNCIGFSKSNLTMERMKEIYEVLLQYQPVWMLLQPSIAAMLQLCRQKYGFPQITSLRYIELSGEIISIQNIKRIEQEFNCAVCNQYGCNEANSIGYQEPNGRFRVFESNVYVEVIRDGSVVPDGEEGEIYITSLQNHVTPFIRYGLGDFGKRYCVNGKIYLELTQGRKDDWISTKDGEKINAYVFLRTFEKMNLILEGDIKQFQVTQTDFEIFDVRIASQSEWTKEKLEELFLQNLEDERIQQAEYRFRWTESIPLSERSGKMAYFVNAIES